MNRTELATAVARATDQSIAVVDRVLDGLEAQLLAAATEGEAVRWPGLFTFEVVQRQERSARNPQTGEAMIVPAGPQPRLKVGARLKRAAQSA